MMSWFLLLLLGGVLALATLAGVRLFGGNQPARGWGIAFFGIGVAVAMSLFVLDGQIVESGRPRPHVTVQPQDFYDTVLVNQGETVALQDEHGNHSFVQVGPGYVGKYRDAEPATYSHVSESTHASFGLVMIFPLALIVLFALWRHFSGGERHADDRPSAWGTVGTILSVLLLGMFFVSFAASRQSQRVARTQQAQAMAEVRLAAAQAKAKDEAVREATIDELHEKLTEPKIQLDEPATEEKTTSEIEDTKSEAKPKEEKPSAAPKPTLTQPRVAPPNWVTTPPKRTGNITRRVVVAGPFKTTSECYRQIERGLHDTVRSHLQELVNTQPVIGQGYVSNLSRYHITAETILRKLCPPEGEYIQVLDTSVGEMRTLHVLLELGPEQNHFLLSRWRGYERQERIFVIIAFVGLVFAGIALVWGLLWLDTFTRGYYTKRLFLGVPAAIIGGICLIALIGEMM